MSERVEVVLSVKAMRAETPEKAMAKARSVAEALLASLPGEGEEFRLTDTEVEPTEDARWEIYAAGDKRVLRGAEIWDCRLTFQAEVELN